MKTDRSRRIRYLCLSILGAVLLAAGLIAVGEEAKTVAAACAGVGLALMGTSAVKLILYRHYEKYPALKRQSEIEAKDERSVAIANQAKAKAFDATGEVLLVVPFGLILIDASLGLVIAPLAIYFLGVAVQILYTVKFGKEM